MFLIIAMITHAGFSSDSLNDYSAFLEQNDTESQ